MKVPCYGDQLSRVRMAGAKDLCAGCHLARQRLDHIYPFCIVDWHTKRSFLKVYVLTIDYYQLLTWNEGMSQKNTSRYEIFRGHSPRNISFGGVVFLPGVKVDD